VVRDNFCPFARRHRSARILADQHALEPAREHLADGVTLTAGPSGMAGKEQTYVAAKKALIEGRVRIPAQYRRLAEQLRAIVAKATPGGGMSISSPRRGGAHGDLVSAWVLAHWAALRATRGPADYGIFTGGASPRADWGRESRSRY
jgi:hypothetical protein